MIGDVIYSLLSNDTDVSALVSTRIYPSMAIEDVVYPYIVYDNSSNEPTDDKDGVSSLDTLSYDIEIYTETLAELNDLGLKVRSVLDRYAGTVSGKVIQSVKYNNENVGYSDEDRVYLKVQDYDFRYYTIFSTLSRITDLTGVKVSTTEIALSWSNTAIGNAGYEVWRSVDAINWSLITTTAQDATSYNNTGLTSATAYIYKIRPTNGTNGGEWSNIISVATDGGTAASGIAYQRPLPTGVTTSFTTYDDVWQRINNPYPLKPSNPTHSAQLDYTAIDPFSTLVDNNAFGNKNRFTDINGLQVYPDDYRIDHLTGLGWWRSFILQSSDWASTMVAINSFTNSGFTDWRLTNSVELESIAKYDNYDVFVYSPFGQSANRTLITSTTSYRNTAINLRSYVTYLGGYSASSTSKTAATLYYFICRNHY